MKLGRVVGNVVSTVKDHSLNGLKLMIAQAIDCDGNAISEEIICTDVANAGIGDIVLLNDDGGAAQIVLDDYSVIIDYSIVGVIDSLSLEDATINPSILKARSS